LEAKVAGSLYKPTKLISEDRGGSEHAVWEGFGGSLGQEFKKERKKKERRIKD
jgi:hypothetical protein